MQLWVLDLSWGNKKTFERVILSALAWISFLSNVQIRKVELDSKHLRR